jgi:uncharacterized protein with von Willebrand factor type A (vWA) domain
VPSDPEQRKQKYEANKAGLEEVDSLISRIGNDVRQNQDVRRALDTLVKVAKSLNDEHRPEYVIPVVTRDQEQNPG